LTGGFDFCYDFNGMARKKNKNFYPNVAPRRPKLNLYPETRKTIWAVVFFTLAAVTILSFFNLAGFLGRYILAAFSALFGWGYFIFPLILTLAGIIFLKSWRQQLYFSTVLGSFLLLLSTLGILEHLAPTHGGWLGAAVTVPINYLFGFWATLIFLAAFLAVSVLIMVNSPFKRDSKAEKPDEDEDEEEFSSSAAEVKINDSVSESKTPVSVQAAPPAAGAGEGGLPDKLKNIFDRVMEMALPEDNDGFEVSEIGGVVPRREKSSPRRPKPKTAYEFPSLNLLESDSGRPTSGDIKANANIIKRTLQNFGIEVDMGEVFVGPTVTQYTLKPAQGVKLSKIVTLQNDLALALAAHPLRIEAPIPGKSLVGIEVPNKAVTLVRLRNLLDGDGFRRDGSLLNFVLGRDVAGAARYADIAKMPHLLIAGATGTGKSVAIHSIIISLLFRNSPETLKLILVDPKRVELSQYNGIPHLLTPVIMEGKKAMMALRWAIKEMERRYQVFLAAGSRDIVSYNDKIKGGDEDVLPYILIIIDELADLMAAYGRDVEALIVRLAQMARATGIHLIVSTQRPSVEVITGLIKANITSRIAFQVASQVDSRTILDMSGAEKLLGNGDLLFMAGDVSKPRRLQGAYVSEKEVKRVVNFILERAEKYFESETETKAESDIAEALSGEGIGGDLPPLDLESSEEDIDDELYDEAKEVVIQAGKASASLLQRRLRVGYARAARLLDIMEEKGLIGPVDGAKPREVYVKAEGGAQKKFKDTEGIPIIDKKLPIEDETT
jgi:S-DNA-T family DNA segregation ATPase FtsK/SpoIIIE